MSRIGKKAVVIPNGVTLTLSDTTVKLKGPKGSISRTIVPNTRIELKDGSAYVTRTNDTKHTRSCHGLMRALLNNMVIGVSTGFVKRLVVDGVGYKAEVRGKKLVLSLGFSHMIEYDFPAGVEIKIESGKNIVLAVHGVDKEKVGQVAAEVRSFRPPDSYKGKGVKYIDEIVRLKAGKQ